VTDRKLTGLDKILTQLDQGLRTAFTGAPLPDRKSPADTIADTSLNDNDRAHTIGLMRVNHTGEVCAQALYQGQALTAKLPEVREQMKHSAAEEIDHLAWCEERINNLGGQTSLLNPIWYAISFGIGAGTGLINDKLSLGFVAATEDQVSAHLSKHLSELPKDDLKSRAIVEEMLVDEQRHAQAARDAGGYEFPSPVKKLMTLASSAMTLSSYRL
jgi:ubiquinone biosynthesis monooxygenase Coq7|tara:strand:- start:1663 stop:2307 length:645 start_codon:yes stop_codon:yes gene_type:complete